MGFWDFMAEVCTALINSGTETVEKNKDKYHRTADWACIASDETLKKRFKTATDIYEKKAIYDELKNRGY